MRFPRITIFVLIATFLLEPLTPAIVQAAPEAGDKGAKESDLSLASLPPFPEDNKAQGIDWSTVDWNQPITLSADREAFNKKLDELQQAGKFEAIAKLKPVQRLMSDPEVLAHYGAPAEVRDLVRGYLLNNKRATAPEHKKALLSMLKLRLKSAQISNGQVLPEQSADLFHPVRVHIGRRTLLNSPLSTTLNHIIAQSIPNDASLCQGTR